MKEILQELKIRKVGVLGVGGGRVGRREMLPSLAAQPVASRKAPSPVKGARVEGQGASQVDYAEKVWELMYGNFGPTSIIQDIIYHQGVDLATSDASVKLNTLARYDSFAQRHNIGLPIMSFGHRERFFGRFQSDFISGRRVTI